MKSIPIALSPCPNDTYAFEALLHEKELFPFQLQPSFYDIDTLNKLALQHSFPIIKISAALYPYITDSYRYIRSGAAFSLHGGPILISNQTKLENIQKEKPIQLATPGIHTSAHAVFSYLFEGMKYESTQVPYHQIAEAVAIGAFDIGILIHEARTTFQEEFPQTLFSIADLHELYYQKTNSYIPLGIIAVQKTIPSEIIDSFEKALSRSIQIAMKRETRSTPFILKHASSLSKRAVEKHISLYVNQETVWMSQTAETALELFLKKIRRNKDKFKY